MGAESGPPCDSQKLLPLSLSELGLTEHHQMLLNFIKGSRIVGKIRRIRFLTPDIVIVVAVGGTVMAGQSDSHTLVVIKQNTNWSVTAFQNLRAQFIGRPEEAQALTNELTQLL